MTALHHTKQTEPYPAALLPNLALPGVPLFCRFLNLICKIFFPARFLNPLQNQLSSLQFCLHKFLCVLLPAERPEHFQLFLLIVKQDKRRQQGHADAYIDIRYIKDRKINQFKIKKVYHIIQ